MKVIYEHSSVSKKAKITVQKTGRTLQCNPNSSIDLNSCTIIPTKPLPHEFQDKSIARLVVFEKCTNSMEYFPICEIREDTGFSSGNGRGVLYRDPLLRALQGIVEVNDRDNFTELNLSGVSFISAQAVRLSSDVILSMMQKIIPQDIAQVKEGLEQFIALAQFEDSNELWPCCTFARSI